MKTIKNYHILFTILITLFLASCNKDDGPDIQKSIPNNIENSEESIYGKWKVLSGQVSNIPLKYIFINEDNTMNFLEEDDFGFRTEYEIEITINEKNITLLNWSNQSYSVDFNQYTIEGNKLNLKRTYGSELLLERTTIIIEPNKWTKELSILNKTTLPFGRIDIAYDGEFILCPHQYNRDISKIDPNTFEVSSSIESRSYGTQALAIENFDHPLRQMFSSATSGDRPSSGFSSAIYRSNDHYYYSSGIESEITGLASEKQNYIWASASDDNELYYYKSNGALSPGEVLKTISLNIRPTGLDYRNGFVYIAYAEYIFKCKNNAEFTVIETYNVPGYFLSGITFDGTNFIVYGYNNSENSYQLLKTNLEL